MKNDNSPPTLQCAASMLRHYAETHETSPQQLLDIFHEGISAIVADYPEDHPLRIKVMIGSYSETQATNVKYTPSQGVYFFKKGVYNNFSPHNLLI